MINTSANIRGDLKNKNEVWEWFKKELKEVHAEENEFV